jgi:hypothetical protein
VAPCAPRRELSPERRCFEPEEAGAGVPQRAVDRGGSQERSLAHGAPPDAAGRAAAFRQRLPRRRHSLIA